MRLPSIIRAVLIASVVSCLEIGASGAQQWVASGPGGATLKIAAPTLVSPADGASITGSQLTFSNVSGTYANFPITYEVQVLDATGALVASSKIPAAAGVTTSVSVDVNQLLQRGSSFTWRVRATYGQLAGPWSSAWTFRTAAAGPGNAHRMILWAAYEKLSLLSDADLDLWKSRGVDGFVVQTRYLDEMGGIEMWTGDANDPLTAIVEGGDVHLKQRTLRDAKFAARCHARGMSVYLGFYLSNFHNLSTPLKVWNDDAGWAFIRPIVTGVAAAAKLLGMDGLATDSEMYRSEDQTWNWNYPGVTQSEATVRSLARQRGQQFMAALLEGFPNVEIINYRIEIPGDWEEKVQQQVNHVTRIWDKSVFVDFWNGIVDTGGFSGIHFLDPIFYKSWQIGSGWDEALKYNVEGVRKTLADRWANWAYASPRFSISPFAWIDPGPSPSAFDDARPPDYVAAQLDAFHRWGEANMFGLYTQHIDDFDYTPYVPAMIAASTPDSASADTKARPSVARR